MAPNRDKVRQTSIFKPTISELTDEVAGYGDETVKSETIEVVPEGAIVPQDDGTWVAGNVQLTSVGLTIHGDVTESQWIQIGTFLHRMQGSLQWLIGDWVIGCQQIWGDAYQSVIEQTGYEYATVRDLAYVARNSPLSVRTDKLSFAHYKLIAPLRLESGAPDEERQLYWVNRAITEHLTVGGLRAAMKQKPPPLSSVSEGAQAQKMLISREKRKDIAHFLKVAAKAGQGDAKAKQRALGQIVQLRQWLDDVEEWLKH